ncbi:hypothetical protein B2J88_01800 [Rhodococcus sp. SRB_17]|nr:hypothetical protein [Rhodococcus sp. SRB_17]
MYLTDEDKRQIDNRMRTTQNGLSIALGKTALEITGEEYNEDFLAIHLSLRRLKPEDVDRLMVARIGRFLLVKMMLAHNHGLIDIEGECGELARDWHVTSAGIDDAYSLTDPEVGEAIVIYLDRLGPSKAKPRRKASPESPYAEALKRHGLQPE